MKNIENFEKFNQQLKLKEIYLEPNGIQDEPPYINEISQLSFLDESYKKLIIKCFGLEDGKEISTKVLEKDLGLHPGSLSEKLENAKTLCRIELLKYLTPEIRNILIGARFNEFNTYAPSNYVIDVNGTIIEKEPIKFYSIEDIYQIGIELDIDPKNIETLIYHWGIADGIAKSPSLTNEYFNINNIMHCITILQNTYNKITYYANLIELINMIKIRIPKNVILSTKILDCIPENNYDKDNWNYLNKLLKENTIITFKDYIEKEHFIKNNKTNDSKLDAQILSVLELMVASLGLKEDALILNRKQNDSVTEF